MQLVHIYPLISQRISRAYLPSQIGTSDHHPLPYPPLGHNVSRMWSVEYWGVAATLADNVSDIVAQVCMGWAATARHLGEYLGEYLRRRRSSAIAYG